MFKPHNTPKSMQKWNIIKLIINLPKDQQPQAILLFFIFTSLTSNTVLSLYFKNEINIERKGRADDKKDYQKTLKTKDSMSFIKDKNYMDFVQEQLEIGARHEWKIDSINLVKINKK